MAPRPERYIRLRLRVENGEISVVGVRVIEGPLARSEKLHGNFAYEATLGRRRIAAESIPDMGETRSFPHPRGARGQEGHYVSELPSYEINVRIPEKELSLSALPRMEIALYRTKEAPRQPVGPGALGEQFSQELREVARLKGVRVDKLPRPLQVEFNRAFARGQDT